MNAYDFDGTIYNGDSTLDFYRFALRRRPSLLRFLPMQLLGICAYALHLMDKTRMKERFFCFLKGIDARQMADDFWRENRDRIFDWYLAQRESGDVVISASPEFLLRPVCERLGVRTLIASRVSPDTGSFLGENCRGEEKVRRLREALGETRIDAFYSDSESDLPLAKRARAAYLVRKGAPERWIF